MNAAQRLALAPTVTLTQVAPRMDCPTCDGHGESNTGPANSPFANPRRCMPCLGTGLVANPDHDAAEPTWYCGCGHQLYAGDDCRTCGAAP